MLRRIEDAHRQHATILFSGVYPHVGDETRHDLDLGDEGLLKRLTQSMRITCHFVLADSGVHFVLEDLRRYRGCQANSDALALISSKSNSKTLYRSGGESKEDQTLESAKWAEIKPRRELVQQNHTPEASRCSAILKSGARYGHESQHTTWISMPHCLIRCQTSSLQRIWRVDTLPAIPPGQVCSANPPAN